MKAGALLNKARVYVAEADEGTLQAAEHCDAGTDDKAVVMIVAAAMSVRNAQRMCAIALRDRAVNIGRVTFAMDKLALAALDFTSVLAMLRADERRIVAERLRTVSMTLDSADRDLSPGEAFVKPSSGR
jgi:hypothetical protein